MHEKFIGHRIRILNNLIKREIESSEHFAYAQSITGTNSWIIAYLAQNSDKDIYQKDLEKKFSVTRSTASKVIKLMVQKGLIVREEVESDARLKKLILTEKALNMHEAIKSDILKLNKKITKGFTDEEIETMQGYIDRMIDNINS